MIKKILVGLAGSTYTPAAIERAVALAKAHGAEVTGVTVVDPRRLRDTKRLDHRPAEDSAVAPRSPVAVSRERIEESIQELELSCRQAGVELQIVRESGETFARLIDLARYHDLTIFGLQSVLTHDLDGGDPHRLLIRLVGAGVRPLLAVTEERRCISRVLIAYNGSMESAEAMKRFVELSPWPGVELKIVTFHSSEDKAYELLLPAEHFCRSHGYKVGHQSNPGDPAVLLLAAATLWQADLIVMGNSGRSALVRNILGDTLLSTLRYTKIPLFLAQ